jgi:hypothetical protein
VRVELNASVHTLTDQVVLELSKHADHAEQSLTCWRACVGAF